MAMASCSYRSRIFTPKGHSHMHHHPEHDYELPEGNTSPYYPYERGEAHEERFAWPEDLIPDTTPTPPTSPCLYDGQPDSALSPEQVLERYWGYSSFRPLQRDLVLSVLEGHDTMGLLPTGGGKSICFQVPGLMLSGITLVITPLISLMKDQVDHLRARGIKATAIHSGMHSMRITQTIDNCIYGHYKFLYISPERLASASFRLQLQHLDVSLLVVDECHCICQWGYDFRPSYLNILELRSLLPHIPVLALTATATPEVAEDIRRILGFGPEARTYQRSFYRPNLSYSIRRAEDKERMMLHILSRVEGSAIVYCRSRDLCRQMARYIRDAGISATYFHAGLTHAERELRQNRWMQGEVRVMVATNAFGMGIDKPDVRLVVHLTMPSSLEEYFQEAGRAGRDGALSYAVAIVGQADHRMLERRLADAFPPLDYIYHTYESLCSFLGVGEGEGLGHSYDFEYDRFVRHYRMRPVQTRSAIEIMEIAGWLSYHEEETRSRLHFVYTRDQLYQRHVGHDQLLRAILRLYTGLFADYVFISETDLASTTGLTPEEVYGMLTALDRMGVVHYIPRKNIPRIVFRIRREDSRYLTIPRHAYHDRYERMRQRTEATVRYITDQSTCRSRLLVGYFGEHSEVACGQCDVCLERVEQGLRHYIVEDTSRAIAHLLAQAPLGYITTTDLAHALPYAATDVFAAVQYLLAEQLSDGWRLDGHLLCRDT